VGFIVRYVASRLSNHKLGGVGRENSSSYNNDCIQIRPAVELASNLYLDPVLE
jgi:hypothetical protein